MSRHARQRSQSGVYHVILRGINRQAFFEDDDDREKFLSCLLYYKKVCDYVVYGYCLMDNHIHLLIKEGTESIGNVMKRIGVSYVLWYNRKYARCGPLFQDRFKSEVVETDEYLLTALRYIHQNPLKAGIIKDIAKYRWSSYAEYVGKSRIIETSLIEGSFAEQRKKFITRFVEFMNEQSDDTCIDIRDTKRMSDEEVRRILQNYAGVQSDTELQRLDKVKRDVVIRKLKAANGVTTRQIARLTGISQSTIART